MCSGQLHPEHVESLSSSASTFQNSCFVPWPFIEGHFPASQATLQIVKKKKYNKLIARQNYLLGLKGHRMSFRERGWPAKIWDHTKTLDVLWLCYSTTTRLSIWIRNELLKHTSHHLHLPCLDRHCGVLYEYMNSLWMALNYPFWEYIWCSPGGSGDLAQRTGLKQCWS